MGHVLRKRSQSQQIREKDKYIEEICRQTKGKLVKAVVLMDFKMKFEAKSARESSVEHFGKRGMGWHGLDITYYMWGKTR